MLTQKHGESPSTSWHAGHRPLVQIPGLVISYQRMRLFIHISFATWNAIIRNACVKTDPHGCVSTVGAPCSSAHLIPASRLTRPTFPSLMPTDASYDRTVSDCSLRPLQTVLKDFVQEGPKSQLTAPSACDQGARCVHPFDAKKLKLWFESYVSNLVASTPGV